MRALPRIPGGTRPALAALAALAPLLGLALLGSCGSGSETGGTAAEGAPAGRTEEAVRSATPRLEMLAPRRALPPEASAHYATILSLQEVGKVGELVRAYPAFLAALAEQWGADDAELAPYHFNYCQALKLSGRIEPSLEELDRGIGQWPTSLQHRVLATAMRMERSDAKGKLLPGTAEGVDVLLDPANRAALRSHHVDATQLSFAWAQLLAAAEREREALAELERTLGLAPGHRPALELRVRLLAQLDRSEEALPFLRELVAVDGQPELRLRLGRAALAAGEAEEVWSAFGELLDQVPGDRRELRRDARVEGARALSELGRHAEARELLLAGLLREPQDRDAVAGLASATRALGHAAAADALDRRAALLAQVEFSREQARKADEAGAAASAAYLRACAFLLLDRPAEALAAIRVGKAADRSLDLLYLLEADVELRLGRLPRAIAVTRESASATLSPIVELGLARLEALAGRKPQAEEILVRWLEVSPSEPRRMALLKAHVAWASLALASEPAEVTRALEEMTALSLQPAFIEHVSEIVLLGRAELLLRRSLVTEARVVLGRSFLEPAGAPAWAGALRLLAQASEVDETGGEDSPTDPSDLLDCPALVRRWSERAEEDGALGRRLRLAAGLLDERDRLAETIAAGTERRARGAWAALLRAYLEAGALRKARETAWYLSSVDPGGGHERWLARALSRPEDALDRLRVLEGLLGAAPEDEELLRMRVEARDLLGLAP